MISEPLAWDGNGRLFVARIETYMQTVPTTDQSRPLSHIMLLKDNDGEGKRDKSAVFIDKLLMPRAILVVGHELCINETDSYDIYAYKDTGSVVTLSFILPPLMVAIKSTHTILAAFF